MVKTFKCTGRNGLGTPVSKETEAALIAAIEAQRDALHQVLWDKKVRCGFDFMANWVGVAHATTAYTEAEILADVDHVAHDALLSCARSDHEAYFSQLFDC